MYRCGPQSYKTYQSLFKMSEYCATGIINFCSILDIFDTHLCPNLADDKHYELWNDIEIHSDSMFSGTILHNFVFNNIFLGFI